MTSTATLVLFLPTASITVASPGPTVLLVLSDGSRDGLRGALPGIAGALLSDPVQGRIRGGSKSLCARLPLGRWPRYPTDRGESNPGFSQRAIHSIDPQADRRPQPIPNHACLDRT